MDKKTEALKLALDLALDVRANANVRLAAKAIALTGVIDAALAEQPTIKQSLTIEQPAQQQEPEYKGWYCAHCQRGVDSSEVTYREQHTVCGRVITDDLPPKAQKQEPVARVINKSIVWRPCDIAGLPVGTPLYTSPQPSKPWVGLTDEDLAGCDDEELKQARYWEAKLREKNA